MNNYLKKIVSDLDSSHDVMMNYLKEYVSDILLKEPNYFGRDAINDLEEKYIALVGSYNDIEKTQKYLNDYIMLLKDISTIVRKIRDEGKIK